MFFTPAGVIFVARPSDTYTILLADDSEDDAFLLKMALEKCNIATSIQWVKDGTDAVAYLSRAGLYADRLVFPSPDFILLDLKMPRMSGLEVLAWMRRHPDCRVIPTIVMSSFKHDADVWRAYDLGANTYFVKPSNFDELAKLIKTLHDYWELSIRPQTHPRAT